MNVNFSFGEYKHSSDPVSVSRLIDNKKSMYSKKNNLITEHIYTLLFSTSSRPTLGPIQPPILSNGYRGVLFPGGKAAGT
jgi:hypothetical protein